MHWKWICENLWPFLVAKYFDGNKCNQLIGRGITMSTASAVLRPN